MARRTPRQKHVHSLLATYQRIKRLQFRRRQRHTTRQQPININHHTDTDSDDCSTTSGSLSLSSLTLDSVSSLSLSSADLGPDRDDTASGTNLDAPTLGNSMDLDISFDDSSDDLSQHSSPPKCRRGPQGLTYHVRKAISAIYSSRYHHDRKFGHGRPPAYLPLILTTYKDHEEFHHLFRQWLRKQAFLVSA